MHTVVSSKSLSDRRNTTVPVGRSNRRKRIHSFVQLFERGRKTERESEQERERKRERVRERVEEANCRLVLTIRRRKTKRRRKKKTTTVGEVR